MMMTQLEVLLMTQPCGGVLRQGMDKKRALRPRTCYSCSLNKSYTYIHRFVPINLYR
jgi:hypothetical protein